MVRCRFFKSGSELLRVVTIESMLGIYYQREGESFWQFFQAITLTERPPLFHIQESWGLGDGVFGEDHLVSPSAKGVIVLKVARWWNDDDVPRLAIEVEKEMKPSTFWFELESPSHPVFRPIPQLHS